MKALKGSRSISAKDHGGCSLRRLIASDIEKIRLFAVGLNDLASCAISQPGDLGSRGSLHWAHGFLGVAFRWPRQRDQETWSSLPRSIKLWRPRRTGFSSWLSDAAAGHCITRQWPSCMARTSETPRRRKPLEVLLELVDVVCFDSPSDSRPSFDFTRSLLGCFVSCGVSRHILNLLGCCLDAFDLVSRDQKMERYATFQQMHGTNIQHGTTTY